MRPFVAGTRGSRLALAQTAIVVEALRRAHAGLAIEVRELRTEGDRDLTTPLSALGGRGVFVKEIEQALLRGEIDLAVHSLKDMPAETPQRLTIAAVPLRGDPRDALICRDGSRLADLPSGARVGTGSARRAALVLDARPDLRVEDIRGNVDTRLRKLDAGEYDAIVLAVAGLDRLGAAGRIGEYLDPDVFVPSAGQGAIAVEARADDAEIIEAARALDDAVTRACVEAERAFLRTLGAGCDLPAGALATMKDGALHVVAMIAERPGAPVRRTVVEGGPDAASELGELAARELLRTSGLQAQGRTR